jgi:hypothetical protein
MECDFNALEMIGIELYQNGELVKLLFIILVNDIAAFRHLFTFEYG